MYADVDVSSVPTVAFFFKNVICRRVENGGESLFRHNDIAYGWFFVGSIQFIIEPLLMLRYDFTFK